MHPRGPLMERIEERSDASPRQALEDLRGAALSSYAFGRFGAPPTKRVGAWQSKERLALFRLQSQEQIARLLFGFKHPPAAPRSGGFGHFDQESFDTTGQHALGHEYSHSGHQT